uniref:Uncharacterized protein n=1 Tax=Lactuca sativa TaxID=4236 RepID=A0A9R1V6X4_LACSA|nr:hypothetical protein LSAT_V11C600313700 [Lactuca sativa]
MWGVTYPMARLFHVVEDEVWVNVMKVNVISTRLVTRVVIEERVERKRGVVVNIGSGVAIVVPSLHLYATYAASKLTSKTTDHGLSSPEKLTTSVTPLQKVIYDEQLDVSILVNNVGVTYPTARLLHEVEEEFWMNVMKLSVIGSSLVTRVVIEGIIERKRGVVVNIGSGVAIVVLANCTSLVTRVVIEGIVNKKRDVIVNIGYGVAIVVPSHHLYATNAASKLYKFGKRAVIEGIVERKRGVIVNNGSGVTIVLPSHHLYATYAANKR